MGWRGQGGESLAIDDILRKQWFEDSIFSLKLDRHLSADPSSFCLLDYGLPDVMAFSEGCGLKYEHMADRCGLFRYKQVFVLEPLPYKEDEARKWTDAERQEIQDRILKWYHKFGFSPILVPPLPPEERRDFVLSRIKKLGIHSGG